MQAHISGMESREKLTIHHVFGECLYVNFPERGPLKEKKATEGLCFHPNGNVATYKHWSVGERKEVPLRQNK
jgi:hypothetical protein